MKALGNLAIVCSRHKDCLFRVFDGKVNVYIGQGPERGFRTCSVDDDKAIGEIIEFLNFGKDVKRCQCMRLSEDSVSVREKD